MRNQFSQKKRRRRVSPRGFSLIELLLGAALLVVGMLGALTMFSTGYIDVRNAGTITSSVSAARQILEDMHLVPTVDLPNFGGSYSKTAKPANIVALCASTPTICANENAMAQRWQANLGAQRRTAQVNVALETTAPLPNSWRITVTVANDPAAGAQVAQAANASGRVPDVVLSTIVR